jgi:hypothetical protein
VGSDLHMNPPYEPPKPLSEQVKGLEDRNRLLEERIGAIIREKVQIEEQSRQDAATIVRLTREAARIQPCPEGCTPGNAVDPRSEGVPSPCPVCRGKAFVIK